jgi:hypothetical protein
MHPGQNQDLQHRAEQRRCIYCCDSIYTACTARVHMRSYVPRQPLVDPNLQISSRTIGSQPSHVCEFTSVSGQHQQHQTQLQ